MTPSITSTAITSPPAITTLASPSSTTFQAISTVPTAASSTIVENQCCNTLQVKSESLGTLILKETSESVWEFKETKISIEHKTYWAVLRNNKIVCYTSKTDPCPSHHQNWSCQSNADWETEEIRFDCFDSVATLANNLPASTTPPVILTTTGTSSELFSSCCDNVRLESDFFRDFSQNMVFVEKENKIWKFKNLKVEISHGKYWTISNGDQYLCYTQTTNNCFDSSKNWLCYDLKSKV